MAFIPVPNGIQCVMIWGSVAQEFTNTMWFQASSFNTANIDSLISVMRTAFDVDFLAQFADDYAIKSLRFYDMSEETGEIYEPSFADMPGTSTGSLLPIQDAVVITLRTAARGRSGRGRMYFSGLTETQLNLGVWQATTVEHIRDAIDDIRTGAPATGHILSVASRYHNNAPRTNGILNAVTEVISRSTIPGNQQRRSLRP